MREFENTIRPKIKGKKSKLYKLLIEGMDLYVLNL